MSIYNSNATGEDEDKECTDASNDTNDFTDVWDKHGNEKCHSDPEDGQEVAAAALEGHGHNTGLSLAPPQQSLLHHWPEIRRAAAQGSQFSGFQRISSISFEVSLQ